MLVDVAKPGLQQAKKACSPGNCQHHTAEFTQHLMPALDGDALGMAQILQQLACTLQSAWRELDRACQGVDNPAEDRFSRRPCGIPLAHFLLRHGFLSGWGVGG
jgi:hypothetical protein